MTTLVVIAKECLPGRVKTRLSPPYSPAQAARIASACLADTLDATSALPADRRILFFDGDPRSALASAASSRASSGWEVIGQPVGSLDVRIGAVLDHCARPTLLLGMDTPHLRPSTLAFLFADWPDDTDAWLGPATDGGFWALALAHPDGDLVRGVPMSRPDTGAHQEQRLLAAGLRVRHLARMTDVDTAADLPGAAAGSPRLARVLAELAVERGRVVR